MGAKKTHEVVVQSLWIPINVFSVQDIEREGGDFGEAGDTPACGPPVVLESEAVREHSPGPIHKYLGISFAGPQNMRYRLWISGF